jgi:CubicO group peptidase (beta-lactamase class C family)
MSRGVTGIAAGLLLAGLVLARGEDRRQDERLTSLITSALRESGAPGVSVAVVENGNPAFVKAFGMADLAAHRAADAGTRYAVGSISKQFTAAMALLLADQGKLSLDDRVSKYLPDLTRAGEVTIRQLLSHTSGYEDYAPQDYIIPEWAKPTTPRAILDTWARKPLNFDPGTQWQYSNTNFVIAAQIIEKVSGEPLVRMLREKVFEPLGMHSAGDCAEHSPADATAYTRFALSPPRPVAREGDGWYSGAGELCMTASDLAKWDIAFIEKKILSPAAYAEFTREVTLQNGDLTQYALGLQVGSLHGIPTVSHSGEVSGFLASNTVLPNRGGAVVVLSNEGGVQLVGSLAQTLLAAVFVPKGAVAPRSDLPRIRAVLDGLRRGKIDRDLFTGHCNDYFTESVLNDYRDSLKELGKLRSITSGREIPRGGMTYRSYRARFSKKIVTLSIYVMPDNKYEQFMLLD